MIDSAALTSHLKQVGADLGFDVVGIAPAVPPPGYPRFLDWIADGREGPMRYLVDQVPARAHPSFILEGVRSIIMAAQSYKPAQGEPDDPPSTAGKIARFARGFDYHELLWRRLERLGEWLEAQVPGCRTRAVADSAPLMERDFARMAGLGWIGKNTLLMNRTLGTYLVLGALLTDADLEPDTPHDADHCGTCTACLDACPTGAFTGPYQLDARHCISTWTIEQKGELSPDSADSLHGWVYGCDICQEVCPWNRKSPAGTEPRLQPRPEWTSPDLTRWFDLPPAQFTASLRGTALKRAKRTGLLRNAAHVLSHVPAAAPLLARVATDDREDPIVRRACSRLESSEPPSPVSSPRCPASGGSPA